MPMSNFPNGFGQGIQIQGFPTMAAYSTSAGPGNVTNPGIWWVDSVNGANGGDGSYYSPLASVAYALSSRVKAYDIVCVKPGHTEAVIAAGTIACTVAGVTVYGFGVGGNRPTFTWTTAATAAITVSAANVVWQNCLFIANFADIAGAFTTTTAKDFNLVGCEFRDTSASLNFLATVKTSTTDNDADGLTLRDCQQISAGLTANTAVVDLRANLDRLSIVNNWIQSLVAGNSGLIYQATTTKVLTTADISWNTLNFIGANAATGGLLITTATTHTGLIQRNFWTGARAAASAIIVTASSGFKFMENYYQTAADKSGILIPANV